LRQNNCFVRTVFKQKSNKTGLTNLDKPLTKIETKTRLEQKKLNKESFAFFVRSQAFETKIIFKTKNA